MFKRSLLVAAAALSFGAYGLLSLGGSTAAQGPGPTAGELVAENLMGSIGAAIGPDGALYVAEAGIGGDTEFELPDGTILMNGFTGQVSRIDPVTGVKTVAVDGIPSVGFGDGSGSGVIDVAFIGDVMYILTTGQGAPSGFPDYPNGIYRVEDDGDLTLVANIHEFNDDNVPDFPDAAPGGNPFSFTPYGDDAFIVTDGNYNYVLLAELDGNVELIAAFDNVVPTGTAVDGDDVYYTEIGSYPHTAEKGIISSLDVESGTATPIASGYANMIDVEFGEDGTMYALNMGDEQVGQGPPAAPFTGTIFIVEPDGDLIPIVTGFMQATSLDIDGDTAFVTTLFGEVWQIDGFNDLEPLPTPTPETPTATPTTPVATATTVPPTATATTVPPTATATATTVPPTSTATTVPPTATATVRVPMPPNTGSGSSSNDGNANWLLVFGAAALAVAAGATVASSRRKS